MKYINFNNAGSSFVKNQTLKIIKDFLEFENKVGGYNAEILYKKELDEFLLKYIETNKF